MTSIERRFENLKYGPQVRMLIPLEDDLWAFTGNDRKLQAIGTLDELIPLVVSYEPKLPPRANDILDSIMKGL